MSEDIHTVVVLGASVAVGTAVMIGAIALSRPLLRRVTADVSRHPD